MHRKKYWIILIIAAVAILLLLIWKLTNQNYDAISSISINHQRPIYISKKCNTMIYDETGFLSYNIFSNTVTHCPYHKESWFYHPMITVYDEKNNIPNWVVYSDRAILAKEHILYLYGHVEFNSLTQNLQLDCIKTNKAKLNLVNQDIESNDQVTLHGPNFNATGINMHGNLRKKNTLLEKVKISYDIQNEKKKPSLVTYSCPFGY